MIVPVKEKEMKIGCSFQNLAPFQWRLANRFCQLSVVIKVNKFAFVRTKEHLWDWKTASQLPLGGDTSF